MNKDWVHWPRGDLPYQEALKNFIDTVCQRLGNPSEFSCPCVDCKNLTFPLPPKEVHLHLLKRGWDPTYTEWVFHGETMHTSTDVHQEGATRGSYHIDAAVEADAHIDQGHEPVQDEGLENHVEEADPPLYPNCKTHTKLSITVELYRHKTVNGLSRKSFDELLKTIGSLLPPDHCLPCSTYEVKKLLKSYQLTYQKIHACINDCCLFRKDLKDADECPKCHYSRWKADTSNMMRDDEMIDKPQKKIPVKVLRYFPIVPRLRRLFQSAALAEQLIWHATNKSKDGKMRHPTDSLAWKHIDTKYPEFASDPRNLRLGLAADGFNPFGDLSAAHSCWPVMLVVYNLPPQLCMQGDNIILSMLIPGKKQPGNDIDVYLQPLIDDLFELWEKGVQVYDSFTKTDFNLKALLMWTINDFPAYGNLSGCTYKGKAACPLCGENTLSNWLAFSRKTVYLNHRRFLRHNHPLRQKKDWFNGEIERKEKPPVMSGAAALECQNSITNDFGKAEKNEEEIRKKKEQKKKNKGKSSAAASANVGNSKCGKRKRDVVADAAISGANDDETELRVFNKRSIFFDLPYWKDLLLRHNIDVMHTEKNVCESIIGTILNIKSKTKDGLKSRNDLKSMGIRPELHPVEINGKTILPPAPYCLNDKEKAILYNRMRNLKVPYGFSSDLRKHFSKDGCLGVLKAHDYHVLMQQILPVALQGLLPVGPREAIFRLCSYFHEICQRAVDLHRLIELEVEVAETLCMFERYFPPSLFDVMMHLTIHLAREVRLCGPVQYRWMYPFERYFDIRKAQAAETGVEQRRNENTQNGSTPAARPLSKGVQVRMDSEKLKIAHRYVLFNTPEIDPYMIMHMDELKSPAGRAITSEDQLNSIQSDTFADWFQQKVKMQIEQGMPISHTVEWLSYGPLENCISYKGLLINNTRFITKDVKRVTQNSGVSIESTTLVAGLSETSGFYGVLEEILLLDYNHMFQIPIFKCDWAHTNFGVKVEDGFTLVNLKQHKNQYCNDPFILAKQARQVFYSRESNTSNWYMMVKPPPRGFHELEEYNEKHDTIFQPVDISTLGFQMDDENESYLREDGKYTIVVPTKKKNKKKKKKKFTS
ncbi:uncharacterized protein LOC113316323 [Papaver somniferum]|uniref:uncharacterized protein LOC113316323 n=1 Tax=Papaver somniferum TaxID=3469 RepID=UPI000E6F6077|nr:uncharacterized protein LOC113316323 [Papaver somniferum]